MSGNKTRWRAALWGLIALVFSSVLGADSHGVYAAGDVSAAFSINTVGASVGLARVCNTGEFTFVFSDSKAAEPSVYFDTFAFSGKPAGKASVVTLTTNEPGQNIRPASGSTQFFERIPSLHAPSGQPLDGRHSAYFFAFAIGVSIVALVVRRFARGRVPEDASIGRDVIPVRSAWVRRPFNTVKAVG